MGKTDLQWSIGAEWAQLRKGLYDAQHYAEQAMGNITHASMRTASVFGQPFRARNAEMAIGSMAQYAKHVTLAVASIGLSVAAVFKGVPRLAIAAGVQSGRMLSTGFHKALLGLEKTFPVAFNAIIKKMPLVETFVRKGAPAAGQHLMGMLPNGMQRWLRESGREIVQFGKTFEKVVASVISWTFKMISGILSIVFAVTKLVAVFAAAGVAIGGILVGMIAKFTGLGKELDDVSKTSGIAGDQILRVQMMLMRMNATSSQANDLLVTMRGNLYDASTGFGKCAQWFAVLGLNARQLVAMKPSEAFEKIVDALSGIGNDFQRMNAATAILGSMGAEAAALAVSGERTDKYYKLWTENLNKAKEAMAGVWMAWARIKSLGTVFFGMMAAQVASTLKPILESMRFLIPILTQKGIEFGNKMKEGLQILYHIITDPPINAGDTVWVRICDIMKAGFASAAAHLGNLLMALMESLLAVLVWVFESAVPALGRGLLKVAGDFGKAMLEPLLFQKYKADKAAETNMWVSKIQEAQKKLDAAKASGDDKQIKVWTNQIALMQKYAEEARRGSTGEGFDGGTEQRSFIDVCIEAAQAFKDALGDDPFKAKKADEYLKSLLEKFNKPVPDPDKDKKKKGGGVLGYPMFLNTFDELRKIGGGIGKQTTGVTDQMLNYTKQIAANTDPKVLAMAHENIIERLNRSNGYGSSNYPIGTGIRD